MSFPAHHTNTQREQLWREAWAALPLPSLAQRLGDTWQRSADPCPSCGKKHRFKIFQRGPRWYFNCFNSECALHAPDGPKDEIGYLAARRGLGRKEAAPEYLRLAVPHLLHENQPGSVYHRLAPFESEAVRQVGDLLP